MVEGGADEWGLVERAKAGDPQAFIQLVQPYHDRVFATAMRLLGNREDALEVTQEAILKTFWKLQTFHGWAHFHTWLYRIALNLCYRRLSDSQAKIQSRSVPLDASREDDEGRPSRAEIADTHPSPREGAERAEEISIVRRAMASMHRRDFHILVLREFDGLSYEEIARRLNLPRGTVMSRIHRARQALAERLRALGLE